VASFGLFANVAYSTPQAFKNAMGRVAYILEGARSLAKIKSYNMRIEYDSNVIEDDFIFGMISNANSVGGFKTLTGKNVALNDGLFEVMLIKMPQNIIELQSIMNALLLMDMRNNYIYKFKASNINIKTDEKVEWTLDGEFGGSLDEVDIINHKQAIKFLVEETVIVDLENDEEEYVEESRLLEDVDMDTIKTIAKNIDDEIEN
jgi:diacylglycerol kinase family enzyme